MIRTVGRWAEIQNAIPDDKNYLWEKIEIGIQDIWGTGSNAEIAIEMTSKEQSDLLEIESELEPDMEDYP